MNAMGAATSITSSSSWVRGVVDVYASLGLDTGAILRVAGIDPADLRRPYVRMPTLSVTALWEAAVAQSGRPALGLSRELASHHMNFDMPAQAMRPSPHLQAGIEGLSRYLELIGDAAGIRLDPDLQGGWLTMLHSTDGWPRERAEYGLLCMLVLCSRATDRQLKPLAAEFTHGEPVDFHPYRMAFSCPLRFNQPAHRILFSEEDLMRPMSAGPSVAVSQERVIERRLARGGHRKTAYRAGETLILQLHLGPPTVARVARALELTEPQLARSLKAEGTSYDRLLDEVRQELAQEYLTDSTHLLERVPALLGYTTNEELAQSCKRWFRATPAQCRQMWRARSTAS